MKKGLILTSIFVVMALTISFSSVAEAKPFTKPVSVSAPTQGLTTDLGGLIEQIFTWSLAVLGIAVFVMFFYAGFLYLTAAGNTANVGEAKSRMTNAVFGAIILLSSYLILNTINPNFVKNTFNLKGLGPQSTLDPSLEKDEEEGPLPPADAGIKHGNHAAEMAAAKNELIAEGKQYPDPNATDECYRFEIVERAVSKIGGGAGFLDKPGGNNCKGFAVDIIAFPDGYIYDVLSGGGDGSMPVWNPTGCGPAGGDGTCPERYRAP